LPPEQADAIRRRNANYFATLVPQMPLAFTRIREDEPIEIGKRKFRVIIGTGHSPEHAALYWEGGEAGAILIAGDMILPRISTNCSVFDIEPDSNPIEWYLASLRKYERCLDDTLILPSHGRPFRKLHERLMQLHQHHDERFDLVRAACKERPRHAADIVPLMFNRVFDTHQTTFAMGEALAHLHALWYRGELVRQRCSDGLTRFGTP
jgi:glyoxylase-like metal-dependent hydrolase (beta-lactamase superfamily II)